MPINTKLKDLTPSRERYMREIQLISRGYYKPTSFPDGKIMVFPWDSIVDHYVANLARNKARSKRLIFDILPKVCNLNGCHPDEFIASEVLLILLVSRSILRQNNVIFETKCPECSYESQETIAIPDGLEKVGEKTNNYTGIDVLVLPESTEEVTVRCLRIRDEVELIERDKTSDKLLGIDMPDHVTRVLKAVVEINNSKPDDTKELVRWFNALPPGDQDYLLREFDKTQPSVSTTIKIKCDSCGAGFEHELKLDDDFFRRGSLPVNRGAVGSPVSPSVQQQGHDARPAPDARPNTAKGNKVAQRNP